MRCWKATVAKRTLLCAHYMPKGKPQGAVWQHIRDKSLEAANPVRPLEFRASHRMLQIRTLAATSLYTLRIDVP